MTPEAYYIEKRNALPYAEERGKDRQSINEIDLKDMRTVHIVGVCGTAMASLASLLIQKGFIVSGSDQACYPPMSNVLKDLQVEVLPFDIKNLANKDLIIIGNMCAPTNIEATFCRDNNIPYFSIGEVVSRLFIADKKSIVVAGTHGKTTTTSIAISTFKHLDLEPAYLVGGVMKEDGKSAVHNAHSKYFIIEGDEYDTAYFDKKPKFLHYKPYISIITSLELDHIDIYKDFHDYEQAFRFLIESTNPAGAVIACIDDVRVKHLVHSIKADGIGKNIITYGYDVDADICVRGINTIEQGQQVAIEYEHIQDVFTINLFGEYNAMNATAIYAVTRFLNFDTDKVKEAFGSFQGAKRRQEVIGVKNNVTVIDDFAHHPTAVTKTLLGIKERFPGHVIKAIFEPRSNSSRAKIFEEEYINAFASAHQVYISTPPMKKEGFNPDDFMNVQYVAEKITTKGIPCRAFSSADEIIAHIKLDINPGDILVVMSNGDFDGIQQKLLNIL